MAVVRRSHEQAGAAEDLQRIEAIRARLRRMKYTPMSKEELAEMPLRRADARASDAIEGIHLTPSEEAFFDMLEEERVPHDLAAKLVREFITDKIG